MDFKARFEGRTTKITKDGDLNGSIAEADGEKTSKLSSSVINTSVSHHMVTPSYQSNLYNSISSVKEVRSGD